MSNGYARRQPVDEAGDVIQNADTPFPARVTWQVSNQALSSVISLNPNTTRLEVGAFGGQGVVIKWIGATDTIGSIISSGLGLATFDNYIPPGMSQWYVVPRETQGTPINPNVQTGSIYGLYQRLAWMNAGATASSILANEY